MLLLLCSPRPYTFFAHGRWLGAVPEPGLTLFPADGMSVGVTHDAGGTVSGLPLIRSEPVSIAVVCAGPLWKYGELTFAQSIVLGSCNLCCRAAVDSTPPRHYWGKKQEAASRRKMS